MLNSANFLTNEPEKHFVLILVMDWRKAISNNHKGTLFKGNHYQIVDSKIGS